MVSIYLLSSVFNVLIVACFSYLFISIWTQSLRVERLNWDARNQYEIVLECQSSESEPLQGLDHLAATKRQTGYL